jgi:formylglycine-generating enzyme required for sulfatase activity
MGAYGGTPEASMSPSDVGNIADLNNDGIVNLPDYGYLTEKYGIAEVLLHEDLDRNGFVDDNDLGIFVGEWLWQESISPDMVFIPGGEFLMGDHFGEGYLNELPVHAVYIDSFYMSRYEITNQQYCEYLNAANAVGLIKVDGGVVYASGDAGNGEPYFSTSSAPIGLPGMGEYSQIDCNDSSFSVRTKNGRDMSNDPAVCVSLYGAAAYCNWRSQQQGKEICYDVNGPNWPCDFSKHGYRLPTEAEWEYAARGGEHSPYRRFPWGDTISHGQANYCADPCAYPYDVNPTEGYHPDYNDVMPYTAPVGTFVSNGYGLYDMAGNVSEWCNDWCSFTYYSTSPYDNPQGPASGTYRVLRGGDWSYDATCCRVANRHYCAYPDLRNHILGFRVVLDLE